MCTRDTAILEHFYCQLRTLLTRHVLQSWCSQQDVRDNADEAMTAAQEALKLCQWVRNRSCVLELARVRVSLSVATGDNLHQSTLLLSKTWQLIIRPWCRRFCYAVQTSRLLQCCTTLPLRLHYSPDLAHGLAAADTRTVPAAVGRERGLG